MLVLHLYLLAEVTVAIVFSTTLGNVPRNVAVAFSLQCSTDTFLARECKEKPRSKSGGKPPLFEIDKLTGHNYYQSKCPDSS